MTTRFTPLPMLLCIGLLGACSGSEQSGPLFVDVTELSGLTFLHQADGSELSLPSILGSGVALFDVDNDGDLDVFLVQGTESAPHQLWRNDSEGVQLRFNQESHVPAFDALVPGVGVSVADADLDGRLDILVTGVGRSRLLLNRDSGFVVAGTVDFGDEWSSSAAWVDVNVDGRPDVYLARVGVFDADKTCVSSTGKIDYCEPSAFEPLSDQLFINRAVDDSGNLVFEDASEAFGLEEAARHSFGVRAADVDSNGWPDIYVTAYSGDNLLWINQRGDRFEERALASGVASSFVPRHRGSVGVEAADIDRDNDLDFVVTHQLGEPHQLYVNDGEGGFLARSLGASGQTEAAGGAGLVVLDADADTRADVYVANGTMQRRQRQVDASDELPLRQSNALFLQSDPASADDIVNGEASEISEATSFLLAATAIRFDSWLDKGEAVTPRTRVSRAVAAGDLDNDGDIDLVVTNNGATAEVLQNTTNPEQWIGVDPVSPDTGLTVEGARLFLDLPDMAGVRGVTEVARSRGYLGASDPRVVWYGQFTLSAITIRVQWPGGLEEHFRIEPEARYHTLVKGQGEAT